MNLRLHISFLFIFLIAGISFTKSAAAKGSNASNWELISESNGIQVLERWVTNDKNLKVKERSGKMTLNCSADDVLNLIEDTQRTGQWMDDVDEVKRLRTVDDKEWFVHTILDTPWPFNKQDMVSKYDVIRDDVHNIIRVLITKEDKLLPPQKGIDRLDTFNAEWVIEKVKDNKVKVTFTTKSTQPPKYPSWAQDPVVRKVFSNNLKNFKAIINKAS